MRSALERREDILNVLSARKFEKIENLANEFKVSRSTIERDIGYLKLKHNIDTRKGHYGGIYLLSEHKPRYLTERQEKLLMEMSEEFSPVDSQIIEEILVLFSRKKK